LEVKHCDSVEAVETFRPSRKLSCVLTAKTLDVSWRIIEREPTRNFHDENVQRGAVLNAKRNRRANIFKVVENVHVSNPDYVAAFS